MKLKKTFVGLLLGLGSPLLVANDLPNIVLINADDLGYGDLSCYGATKIQTPNIDKLAKEGTRFTDAHSPSAVCSPSRYGLLTGNYPTRINLWGPTTGFSPLTIKTDQPNMASVLKKAGYSTAIIGKWHLGLGEKATNYNETPVSPGPNDIGFDYSYVIPSANSVPPFIFMENGTVVGHDPNDPIKNGGKVWAKALPPGKGAGRIGGGKVAHELYDDFQIGNEFVALTTKWLGEQKEDKPYFLYLATSHIHHPFTPDPRFNGTSECGKYGDFAHELDWMVGEVVKAVEASEGKNGRETLIIFTSDNGGMLNDGGQKAWTMGHRLNGELQGFKFGVWEGGHRVPMIVKWDGTVPAGRESSNLMSQVDLLATFAEITGQELPDDLDSVSQLDELKGEVEKPIREELVVLSNSSNHVSIRTKKWLYIPARDTGGFVHGWGKHAVGGVRVFPHTGQQNSDVVNGKYKKDAPKAQLYDLENDLGQTKNVINDFPEIAKQLSDKVLAHKAEIPKTKKLGWIADKGGKKK
ncbi:sulfatase family protein [Rubritalea sp.]|uniref:sulfatase family protein n=1 Tax=Rubritalea sp. TaxID=2109375 RepID=UPI003EF252B3